MYTNHVLFCALLTSIYTIVISAAINKMHKHWYEYRNTDSSKYENHFLANQRYTCTAHLFAEDIHYKENRLWSTKRTYYLSSAWTRSSTTSKIRSCELRARCHNAHNLISMPAFAHARIGWTGFFAHARIVFGLGSSRRRKTFRVGNRLNCSYVLRVGERVFAYTVNWILDWVRRVRE